MRQGNILNEATAVSPATFLGEAIRILILIVARDFAVIEAEFVLRRFKTVFDIPFSIPLIN